MNLFGIAAAGALAAGWGYLGYRGWTWIPIGHPARKNQIRVACVGDSITYGALIPNWYKYNYPHRLQGMAGKQYCVHNYGFSSYTAMETGDHPYPKTLRFRRSLSFQPDVVFLMFGTNDSKKVNWRGREEFKRQYEKLLRNYLRLKSKPRVIVMLPPCPHHMNGEEGSEYTFGIRRNQILEIGEVLHELAEQYGLETLDMFTSTQEHPEWFLQDGIHPNANGAEQLAKIVYMALMKKEG